MILLCAYWGYLFFVFAAAGGLTIRLMSLGTDQQPPISINMLVWLGVAAITMVCIAYNLFLPITASFHLAVVILLSLWLIIDRKSSWAIYRSCLFYGLQEPHTWEWIRRSRRAFIRTAAMAAIVSLAGLYTAGFSTGYETGYDTDLYHAQSVQWAKKYAAVPGLGNIHLRLAFNNASFLTAAFFDVYRFKNKSYHVFNSFLFVVVAGMLFYRLVNLLLGEFCLTNTFSAVVLFYLLHYTHTVNSLSPDVTVTLLTISLAVLFLDILDQRKTELLPHGFLLICFGITVKLSMVPFILLPVFTGFHFLKNGKRVTSHPIVFTGTGMLRYAVPGSLILVPWIIRGIILSGYLLWAFPAVDLLHVDWKVPKSYVTGELAWIRSWAWAPGTSPPKFAAKSRWFWLLYWTKAHRQLLYRLGIFASANVILGALFRDRYLKIIRKIWPACLVLFLGLLFWFVNAPDVRFAAGYLFCAKSLLLALPLSVCKGQLQKIVQFSAVLFILFTSMHLMIQNLPKARQSTQPLPAYKKFPITEYVFPSGLRVNLTVEPEDRCGNADIPCMPFHYKDFEIVMRGKDLQRGFRRLLH